MPRISSESKSGAVYRRSLAGKSLVPPPHLPAAAKELWRQIVASKPRDRFDPGNEPLLEAFCFLAVHARSVRRELAAVAVTSPECAKVERRLNGLTKTLGTLASSLRLSVQAKVDRRSGELDEPGDGKTLEDRLIGGAAINRRAN